MGPGRQCLRFSKTSTVIVLFQDLEDYNKLRLASGGSDISAMRSDRY